MPLYLSDLELFGGLVGVLKEKCGLDKEFFLIEKRCLAKNQNRPIFENKGWIFDKKALDLDLESSTLTFKSGFALEKSHHQKSLKPHFY